MRSLSQHKFDSAFSAMLLPKLSLNTATAAIAVLKTLTTTVNG